MMHTATPVLTGHALESCRTISASLSQFLTTVSLVPLFRCDMAVRGLILSVRLHSQKVITFISFIAFTDRSKSLPCSSASGLKIKIDESARSRD